MKRLLQTEIHVWVIILLFCVIGAGLFFLQSYGLLASIFPEREYVFTVPSESGGQKTISYGPWESLSSPDFYNHVKNDLVVQRATFIEADLTSKILRVYRNGIVVKETPIVAKGKKGSWWETPAGLYKAEAKNPKHSSSFARVDTAWNIIFQGNFFIHGIPTHRDSGEEVATSFSGGCIRIPTADAEEVYRLVEVGTPILIYETSNGSDVFQYDQNIPPISAEHFLVADIANRAFLVEQGGDTEIQLEKLVTILDSAVALDYMNIERNIIVPVFDETIKDTLFITPGETYRLYDLLFPLLIDKSARSADTIASELGRARFEELLKRKAEAIGMNDTTIVSGIDFSNAGTTTMTDLFHLGVYLYQYRSFILDMTRGVTKEQLYGKPVLTSKPQNVFMDIDGYRGGSIDESLNEDIEKNEDNIPQGVGFAVFDVEFRGMVRPLLFIVIGSSSIENDIRSLYQYIKTAYR